MHPRLPDRRFFRTYRLRVLQRRFAILSSTMDFEAFIAAWGRPSSVIFLRGPSILPYTTESRPYSASCLLALTHQSQNQSGFILRRPRRVTSPSSASIPGHFTCYLRWPPARRAQSAPIRSGSSKPALWYARAIYPPFLRSRTIFFYWVSPVGLRVVLDAVA